MVRLRDSLGDFFLLLFLPWFCIWVHGDWVYTSTYDQMDAWYYTGYFHSLGSYLRYFGPTYYYARLPWVLLGYGAHEIFGSAGGNLCLRLFLYYASTGSLYLLLRSDFGNRVALLGAIALGIYPHFLSAIGHDYFDGIAISLFLLTQLFLKHALSGVQSRSAQMAAVVAGGIAACLVHVNSFCATLLPPLALFWAIHLTSHGRSAVFLRRFFSSFLVGVVLAHLVLEGFNRWMGGGNWFFIPTLKISLDHLVSADPNHSAWKEWSPYASYLVFPSVCLVFTLLSLIYRRFPCKEGETRSFPYQMLFVSTFLVMGLWEIAGQNALQRSFYFNLVIPSAFLAMAAQLAPWVEGSLRSFKRIGLLFCLGSAFLYFNWQWKDPFLFPSAHFRSKRDSYFAVLQGMKLAKSLREDGQFLFWYDLKEKGNTLSGMNEAGQLFESIASTYLWGYRLFSRSFEALPENAKEKLEGGKKSLFLLTEDLNRMSPLQDRLKDAGLRVSSAEKHLVQEGQIRFFLVKWSFLEE